MKITVSVCRLTELRSKVKQAYLRGEDVNVVQDACDELLDHAHARFRAGDWTDTERAWFDAHPRFVQYCELGDDMRWADFYDEMMYDMSCR